MVHYRAPKNVVTIELSIAKITSTCTHLQIEIIIGKSKKIELCLSCVYPDRCAIITSLVPFKAFMVCNMISFVSVCVCTHYLYISTQSNQSNKKDTCVLLTFELVEHFFLLFHQLLKNKHPSIL